MNVFECCKNAECYFIHAQNSQNNFYPANFYGPEHLSLKVPNIKFDVSVSVDSMQLWFLMYVH